MPGPRWIRNATILSIFYAFLPHPAHAQPAEFLPVRHAIYEDIEYLTSRGLLDSLGVYTRPLARIDVARALLRARRLHPGLENELHYQRVEREMARELTDLDQPPERKESGPLVDSGPRERRFRIQGAGHLLGDYDEARDDAHFRLRDETNASLRASLQLWPAFGIYEELAITRIRGDRADIDPLIKHTDIEFAVPHAEITGRTGPMTFAAGYDEFRWGPGARGTLLLSQAPGPMEFVLIQGQAAGRVTATALSGVLSRSENRMLAMHRIEFTPTRRLRLGVAEGVRYFSSSIDLLYGLGILPYTLIERIQRREATMDSTRGEARSNVMASADATFHLSPSLFLYGELLVDDFATEDKTMPDRYAWQAGVGTDRPLSSGTFHFQGELTRVLNFTYSVDYGENFIHHDRPIGYVLGPDVKDLWLESAYDLSRDWQVRWTGDLVDKGEGKLGIPWVEGTTPVPGTGLTGTIEHRRETWADLRWIPRDNVDVSVGAGYRHRENVDNVSGVDQSAWLGRIAADVRY